MRPTNLVRAATLIASAVALIVACGSEDSSTFNPEVSGIDAGTSSSSSGGFNNVDSGNGTDASGPVNCKPLTCAQQGIECGAAGDGCGGLIADCGKCGDGKRCGGPGAPSKCVDPNIGTVCTPKTCTDLNIQCGPAGDGCGGLLNCGTCEGGSQCGANGFPSQCVVATPSGPDGGTCVKKTCNDYLALGQNCGEQSDGCGGKLDCGGCSVAGEFCGGGGASKCGNPGTCTKKTCNDYPVGTCGQQSDNCGSLTTNCGTCGGNTVCGGGGVPSMCGGGSVAGADGGACTPKTTCGATECGDIADGCGGIVKCGTGNCGAGTTCGGGGTPNVCGTPTCTKIPQATACAGKNCGTVADGCGTSWSCGGNCTAPAICGGGGTPNVCGGGVVLADGGGTCTPLTTCPANSCGPIADGCGGSISCGTCEAGQCGGAGVPSRCGGGNVCIPKTKTAACGTQNCGFAPDGCGASPTPYTEPGHNQDGTWSCGTCPTGQQCGIGGPNQCGSLSGPCIPVGQAGCTSNSQCCSPGNDGGAGICGATGTCLASQCINNGTTCFTNSQCCSGKCNGTCQDTDPTTSCAPSGSTCGVDGDCCSQACVGGRCSTASSFCKQNGDSCTSGLQCCGGACVGAVAGGAAGYCGTVAAPGGGLSCKVAGTVVSTCTATTGTYACQSDCCSGSCGQNDSIRNICQPPSGCAPQGELCYKDSDCCQEQKDPEAGVIDLPGVSLTCSKPAGANGATDPGRCNNATSCSKPGEICGKTGTAFSCPFNNGCCEPPDIKFFPGGGNCQSNPAACCKQDNLGIPRCVAYSLCRAPGQSCSTSSDCCNALPCIDDDNNPNTPKICGQTACQPDEGACTVDGDCCNGNCYHPDPRNPTGVCRIPSCVPKDCAFYQAQLTTGQVLCGQQSDGCGGLTVNCGTCTVPGQTCGGGGTANVCGGTVCNPITVCPAGYNCGSYPNGCGGTVNCGTCTLPETCGGGGVAYQCGKPKCDGLSCTDQGLQCGQTGDGCGNVIDCPPCDPGTTCGGGGQANKCGAPSCTAKTCAQIDPTKNCGTVPNGCGGTSPCGDCTVPGETCGGGGAPNVCGKATCTAKTCAQVLSTIAAADRCGQVSDQCGMTLDCGTCPSGKSCVENKCVGSSCVPNTCTQLGVECGQVADGCGGLTPVCGICPVGQGCGAGGVPNKCGSLPCTPKSCTDLGAVCGQVADGCGGLTQSCGDCGGNLACKNGACVQACTPRSCTDAGANCGYVSDGCGGVVDCGVCPDGYECGYGGMANVCGRYNPN